MNDRSRNAMLRRMYAQKRNPARMDGVTVTKHPVPRKARKDSECPVCGKTLKQGELYVKQGDREYVHVACSSVDIPSALTRTPAEQQARERKQRATDPKRYERKARLERLKKELL